MEDGYTGDVYCQECEKVVEKGKAIKAKGHVMVQGQNAAEASCAQPGYTGDTCCENCGEILERGQEIPAPGHELVPHGNSEEPTCNRQGYTGDASCSVCQFLQEGTAIPTRDHHYQQSVCSFCGWMLPGFYQDDVLIMSWADLKANGYVTVRDGKLVNVSGDYGMGKLVVGEDVTILEDGLSTTNVSEVWLPASIRDLGAYKLSNRCIQKVVLFGTMTTIPENCFFPLLSNDGLQSLILPDTVTTLEYRAVGDRRQLKEFRFPAALEYIGREAFLYCGLTDIVLPEGLKTVSLYAFSDSAVRTIKFPASLETLEPMVFTYCRSLKTVDLSACENITELEYGLFRNCDNLTTLLLPPNLKAFSSSYDLFGADTWIGAINLKHLDLPEGFVSFGAERFINVRLTSIVWPASLVDGSALQNCPLEKIYYTGTEAQWKMARGHDFFPEAEVIFEYQRS